MPLLPANATFDGPAILASLAAQHPGLVEPERITSSETTAAATLEGGGMGLGLIASPIPLDELAGPAAVAWHWPSAASAVEAHQAHVIVHAMSSTLPPLQVRLVHTHLVAEVLRATDGLGVYVGDAMLLRSTEDYLADAASAGGENLPLLSWIGFNPVAEDDASSAYTTGLSAFGFRELEIHRSPRPVPELLGRLADAAYYQISTERELRDGDTFGETANERRKIRHTQSRFIPDLQVALLEF